ncbi:hypothetical protein NYP18_06025 [Corynebacterium sp. YIM 101645]|uniref:DUF559 domain-containing protein n=1 Tax=Corynebacterium lemuris TaxID=1859292 RepID=A0ABT2FZ35_9CORY|nr:hypothetical protein [Corynebacterium lemuris]MCS5479209.1 hypothetical protein [Corynebacterium lemuris]
MKLRKFIVPMRDWAAECPVIHLPAVDTLDRELRRRLAAGEYVRLCPEMVVEKQRWEGLAGWQQDEARVQAVGLCTHKAVLVGRSAARVHGIPVPGRDEFVELNLPGRNSRRPRQEWPEQVVYRAASLGQEEITTVKGLRVSTIMRTAVDIARYHGVVAGIVAFDAVLAMQYMSRSRAENMVELLGPVRGISTARRALALADPRSESPLESWGRAQILAADLPGLETLQVQVPVLEGRYRLDLLLNGHLAVELHGEIKYDGQSTGVDPVMQMKRDRERERLLQNAGFMLVHATYADLVEGRLSGMVRAGLARQAA